LFGISLLRQQQRIVVRHQLPSEDPAHAAHALQQHYDSVILFIYDSVLLKPGKIESLSVTFSLFASAMDDILGGDAVLRCPADVAPDSSDVPPLNRALIRPRQIVTQ
jgi:hypothetical protein